ANQTYRLTDTPDNLGDVTGSHIVSNKPIAVFSGNRIANIPIDVFYGDHILDQMIPVDYWSNSYIAIPLADRDRYTLRILAAKNDTLININDSVNTTINAGEFYELIMTETAVISSNEQVLIAQFAHGGQDDAILTEMGDPFMVILPSENQFINNYKFSTIESTITNNYINLIINKNDINNIKLDDSAIDPLLFFNINETYSGAKVPISEGNHTIKSIMKFGLIIYGFDRYDSYGHTGG
ncbi:MAG: IgGFc-binding protein, partial [Spirochaetes bacterium]|nr:IgGFc-binding protein [Spirochaetota bacterium]